MTLLTTNAKELDWM